MWRSILVVTCLSLICGTAFAETTLEAIENDTEFDRGSPIDIQTLSDVQADNLAQLGRVWGFLKYHHPAVASGTYHWDYELVRILPFVLNATDHETAIEILERWTRELGTVEMCGRCAKLPDDMHLTPELEWIRDESVLGGSFAGLLQEVYLNRPRRAKGTFVATENMGVGNASFPNEPDYAALEFPDAGFQLLALFRYWNIIEYWFPYRDLIDEDWAAVLRDSVPAFALAEDRGDYERALARLIARTDDTHSGFFAPSLPPQGKCIVHVRPRVLEGRVVIGSYRDAAAAADTGLEIGDVIVSIDGTPVEERMAEWAEYYASSNEVTAEDRLAARLFKGKCETEVTVAGLRGDEPFERTVRLDPPDEYLSGWYRDRPGNGFQMLDDRVAYLKLSDADQAKVDDYLETAKDTKGWVLDLRNYPSDFMVFSLGSRFVDRPTSFARFTRPHFANPGAFTYTEPTSLRPQEPRYTGKVVILIDEIAISSAEYHAMAFRVAPDAVVIGSQTAGADGNVSRIPLPGGHKTVMTGIGVFYPDKTPTQQIGIVPDIEIRPTIEGLRAGRDEVLERALREILGPDVPEEEVRRLAARPPE